jgi:hypothetical protein
VIVVFVGIDIGFAFVKKKAWMIMLPPFVIRFLISLGANAFSLSLFTVLFAMVYKVLPERRIPWRDVWVGAAVSSVLFGMGPRIARTAHELKMEMLGLGPQVSLPTTPNLIAIEFKAPPKRLRTGGPSKAKPRLSPAQAARQIDLGACGVPYLVIDDLADLVQSLKALGVPLRGRAM